MQTKLSCQVVPLLAALVLGTLTLGCASEGQAAKTAPVTINSLLGEMVDRDASAKWPAPAYTCKEVTSHDQRKNDPGDPATWHSNNDSGQFIHTELNGGRREWVIMEDSGPGAITRFWTPLSADKDNQIVRFYLDGSPTPVITAKLNDLISGQSFARPPLAFAAWDETDLRHENETGFKAPRGVGADLYLPIPFARSCKITLDSVPFYYGINYRVYEPNTPVRTFTMTDYNASRSMLNRISEAFARDLGRKTASSEKTATLAPGEELALDLRRGSAAVQDLMVQLDPPDAGAALRSTVVEATFDGEKTVWCPLSEFFGAGVRLSPVQDWWRTVKADGALTARWVMPYQHSARLALRNLGSKPITLKLAASTKPWNWTDRSLHFHASWRCQLGIKTRPISDWNFLEAQGQGVYVGDTLTVFTPEAPWYGEGDERIYVDAATYPGFIGTGTEDYYGYAWGMATYFSSPFISMPRRDSADRNNWKGYTTTSRLRSLDAIPFRTAIRHDMEIWNWADTAVDYAVGTFWYARPGAQTNRTPQPTEAAAPLKVIPPPPGQLKIPGAVEFETLPITGKSLNLPAEVQGGGLHQGQWSGGEQLFVRAEKVGDYVELPIPVADNRPRKVTLYGTKAADYGILRFSINGQPAGPDYDAYNPDPIASGPIELGTFTPKDGVLILRVEIVGTNPASTGARYYFGLDCVTLGEP